VGVGSSNASEGLGGSEIIHVRRRRRGGRGWDWGVGGGGEGGGSVGGVDVLLSLVVRGIGVLCVVGKREEGQR